MNKPHEHKELILKWADGAEIEAYDPGSAKWVPATTPIWQADTKYRVKPAAPVVETKMTEAELAGICHNNGRCKPSITRAVNAAIARLIADGQVVTKEDHEEAVVRLGDRLKGIAIKASEEERAARDMAVARAVEAALSRTRSKADLAAIIAKVPK